jgi:signal transduction histidine kinase
VGGSTAIDSDVLASGPADGGPVTPEDLAELMRAFNAAAGELEQTHQALRSEVSRLKGELHEANRRLERSRRLAALGEMAAGIAHEVRNPLAAIALHAEMLRDDLGEGECGQTAGKILRAARELDGVVGDVLRFARELEPTLALVDAVEPARRAVSTCQMMADVAGVELDLVQWAESADVELDGGLVAQALANLIRNAVEAIVESSGEAPGRVRVTTGMREFEGSSHVAYVVEDTGPGLPAGAVERMFNPFYTTRQTGCGLGLAMVQRIVDAHGGRVDAGDAEGGGARFELTLPARSPALVTEGAA